MKVGYYPDWDKGSVKEFLDALRSNRQRIKAVARIDADIGKLALTWPHWHQVNISVKSMTGHKPLCELRREYEGIAYRIFFCVKKDQIWLLHAIEKKSQKTPLSDLQLAFNQMRMVLKGGS